MMPGSAIAQESLACAQGDDVLASVRAVIIALRAAGDIGLEHDAVRAIAGRTMLPAVLLFHAGFVAIDGGQRFRLTPATLARLDTATTAHSVESVP